MRICKGKNYEEISQLAAEMIGDLIIAKPDAVLGLATGSSPLGIYKNLISMYHETKLDFQAITAINLDEYKDLSPENPLSYSFFMWENLFRHINIKKENTYIPNGMENDTILACNNYDTIIEKIGGIDLQLLGLGHNGHIGFNEPSDSFTQKTHCVNLAESTIEANARFFEQLDQVPKQAYTMGIQTIMSAETILMIVSGKDKAEIVKKAFWGPITSSCPASILQLHKNFILVCDEDALGNPEKEEF